MNNHEADEHEACAECMSPLTLYHGDNGSHEFYETENDPKCLIIRHNRMEIRQWIVMTWPDARERRGLPSYEHDESLSALLRRLHERTGFGFAVDASREWRWRGPMASMELVEA